MLERLGAGRRSRLHHTASQHSGVKMRDADKLVSPSTTSAPGADARKEVTCSILLKGVQKGMQEAVSVICCVHVFLKKHTCYRGLCSSMTPPRVGQHMDDAKLAPST